MIVDQKQQSENFCDILRNYPSFNTSEDVNYAVPV